MGFLKKLLVRVARQSPAMIVAMLALFVALTGTAVATTSALIGSAQIRNNSITGLDVKNRSLRPIDFRGSVRGPRGLRGLLGATGATGATGAAGAKGDEGRQGRSRPDAVGLSSTNGRRRRLRCDVSQAVTDLGGSGDVKSAASTPASAIRARLTSPSMGMRFRRITERHDDTPTCRRNPQLDVRERLTRRRGCGPVVVDSRAARPCC